MAPALLGPHALQECPTCRETVTVDASQSVPAEVACFNCGTVLEAFNLAEQRPGSRVIIDRWTASHPGPQRFDIVAFVATDADRRWLTKRIVGLPGETVELVGGDVWIDGKCAAQGRCGIPEFRHFGACRSRPNRRPPSVSPCPTFPSEWLGANTEPWDWVNERKPKSGTSAQAIDWLDYMHRSSTQVVGSPHGTQQILDECAYNQAESRQLHVVHDVACTATIRFEGDPRLYLELPTPFGPARLRLTPGQRPEVSLDGHAFSPGKSPAEINDPHGSLRILFGYWDRQLVVRLDDAEEQMFPVTRDGDLPASSPRYPPDSPIAMPQPRIPQVSIGARGNHRIELTEFEVWRDVYYYADVDRGAMDRFQLGPDQFALLGDNPSRSDDARSAVGRGIVRRDQILGIVTRLR